MVKIMLGMARRSEVVTLSIGDPDPKAEISQTECSTLDRNLNIVILNVWSDSVYEAGMTGNLMSFDNEWAEDQSDDGSETVGPHAPDRAQMAMAENVQGGQSGSSRGPGSKLHKTDDSLDLQSVNHKRRRIKHERTTLDPKHRARFAWIRQKATEYWSSSPDPMSGIPPISATDRGACDQRSFRSFRAHLLQQRSETIASTKASSARQSRDMLRSSGEERQIISGERSTSASIVDNELLDEMSEGDVRHDLII